MNNNLKNNHIEVEIGKEVRRKEIGMGIPPD